MTDITTLNAVSKFLFDLEQSEKRMLAYLQEQVDESQARLDAIRAVAQPFAEEINLLVSAGASKDAP